MFDKAYYDQLYEFFNINNDVTYNVSDLATDTEKFIAYTRLYIHLRALNEAEVLISFDEKQIRITEFFQNVLNAQKTELLQGKNLIGQLNNVASTPLTQSIEPVLSTPVLPQVKKSPFGNR